MTALIPANFGQVSTKFANQNTNDDLSSGIQSSFGLIGYKGKVWSIRYRGDETPLMREDGDGPKGSIEVVVLSASKAVSKVWYEQGYVEGSTAAPDCFSNNGIAPDPASAKVQCASCALCPHNQWGSRITPAGKNGKACADSKRLAVVPLQDLSNEVYGGPMLLRVPAASLQDLAMYGQKMSQLGYPYFAIGTRIGFDPNESYPKFTFGAIRPLSDDEAETVLAERTNHTVERILSENEFAVPATEAASADPAAAFEQPPADQAAQQQTTAKSSVGDQARAAAAANKARVAADAKAAKAAGAAADKAKAQQQASTQPETTGQTEKQKEAAAKRAALQAEIEALEKAGDEEELPSEVTESDEDRELREMEEKMAALKAKKLAAASATTAASSSQGSTSAQTQVASATASPSDDGANDSVASDFEADLDSMLDNLLPS